MFSGPARPGPTGRRAGLIGGPDVWEVIETLLTVRDADPDLADDALIVATAEATGVPARKVRIAVRYYAAYPNEIDQRVVAHRQAVDQAEATWHTERELLRGKGHAS